MNPQLTIIKIWSWTPDGGLTERETGRLTVGRNITLTFTLTLEGGGGQEFQQGLATKMEEPSYSRWHYVRLFRPVDGRRACELLYDAVYMASTGRTTDERLT
jgi:hypothetical protein